MYEFTWNNHRDQPNTYLLDWADRTLKEIVQSVQAYSKDKIKTWKVYATGNVGAWMICVDTQKPVQGAIGEPTLTPAVMLESTGIRSGIFEAQRDFWHIATPGLIMSQAKFLPTLQPTDGATGRNWLNAKDIHMPLAQWLAQDKPEGTAMDWIHVTLANDILPLGDSAVSLARQILGSYLYDWPVTQLSRQSLWSYFMNYAPRTMAWKNAARPKRAEIITSVGNALCQPYPGWDSHESWTHLRKFNE